MPVIKNMKIDNDKIQDIAFIGNDILLVTDKSIKLLNKELTPKHTLANTSKYQAVFEDKVVTVGENIKVLNFKDGKFVQLIKFLSDNVSCVTLSSLLIGIGKNNGSFAIYSIIGIKNLINLNIFKSKIENIAFYTDSIIVVQSKNLIRGIDAIEKKIEFKYNDTSDITAFTIANDLCFIANKNKGATCKLPKNPQFKLN
jgi:hypothetical protein